nr:calcineurin B-like protein 10 isoform X1 [Ipomoea batatas]GME12476.1 calcineurin B-like protein 10 isoform X1 [Ipomoea batatas]
MVIAILMESDTKLSDDLLEEIIDKTFADVDADNDGKINREDWKGFVTRHPSILKNMTLPDLKPKKEPRKSFIKSSIYVCICDTLFLLVPGIASCIVAAGKCWLEPSMKVRAELQHHSWLSCTELVSSGHSLWLNKKQKAETTWLVNGQASIFVDDLNMYIYKIVNG